MVELEHSATRVARPVLPPLTNDPRAPELYRQIYVSLDLPADAHTVVIGVTSAISGEGRTTVALGLAQTLAVDLDVPIALVEVDLERPSLALHFDIPPAPGLCEVLRGDGQLEAVMHPVSDNLSVVTTGAVGPDSARLLRQLPLGDPFHTLHGPDRIVILDLPPLINHSYSPLAASIADAIVLVVRAGVTPLDLVREAIARLEDRPPSGVVFNAPRSSLPTWWPGRGV
jgi:non-specific protein-tyrosine kinase